MFMITPNITNLIHIHFFLRPKCFKKYILRQILHISPFEKSWNYQLEATRRFTRWFILGQSDPLTSACLCWFSSEPVAGAPVVPGGHRADVRPLHAGGEAPDPAEAVPVEEKPGMEP